MESVVHILSWLLIVGGSVFVVVGAVGLVRMPDIYTRMHAVGVSDTLGAGLLIAGMMLQAGFGLVSLKLLFLLAIFFFSSPVTAHALAQAALHERIEPILVEDRRPPPAGGPRPRSPAKRKPPDARKKAPAKAAVAKAADARSTPKKVETAKTATAKTGTTKRASAGETAAKRGSTGKATAKKKNKKTGSGKPGAGNGRQR